ncbi:hypothetical protein X975_15642, partial [Stegodyphus mimosarum]
MFLIISLPKLFAFMVRKFLLPDEVFLSSVFMLSTLLFVQGNVDICHNVYPPFHGNEENCTLVCSLKFQHAVSSVHSDEVALCVKNSSLAVFCVNPLDCRQYHVGAYCKMIPCLCKSEDSYIFHSSLKIKKVNTCVVSAKHLSLDMPIVPFPWKTLLIVCAIVFVFAACLICLRWVSPLIRSMQAKRASRINRERQAVPLEDNARLFTSVSQQNDSLALGDCNIATDHLRELVILLVLKLKAVYLVYLQIKTNHHLMKLPSSYHHQLMKTLNKLLMRVHAIILIYKPIVKGLKYTILMTILFL